MNTRTITATLALFSVGCLSLSAQNANYRVEQIVQLKMNQSKNTMDTIIQKYDYNNGQLTQVEFLKNKTVIDVHSYKYENNTITVNNKNNRMERSYTMDKSNVLQEYWNDGCDKFTFSYSKGKIKSIDRFDKCDNYNEGNDFVYNGMMLSKVKTYVKSQPKISTDYSFTYDNDKIVKIVWDQNLELFSIKWDGTKISYIDHSKMGVRDWKDEFVYDENGNIKEETIYKIENGKEMVSDKYKISYSANKGNDNIVWSTYYWKINIFINQRSYNKFVQMRY